MPKANARPKCARKDTKKIAPFCAKVEKHKTQRVSQKRSKAQRNNYSLDIEDKEERDSKENKESNLPDITRLDRVPPTSKFEGNCSFKTYKPTKASKSKLFGKTSKVVDNAPACPAISPKKKWARSPSPIATLKKRSHSVVDTQKQPNSKGPGTDWGKGARGEAQLKESSKSSKSCLSAPQTSSHNSSHAPSTLASSCAPLLAHSSKFTQSTHMGVDQDLDKDSNPNLDLSSDLDKDKGTDKDSQLGEDEDGLDNQQGKYNELSDRPTKCWRAPTTGPKLKGKVKLGDFSGTECLLVDETVRLVQCHVLLINYFLDRQELFLVTKQCWEEAVRKMGGKLKNFPFYNKIFAAVKVHIHSFRGRLCKIILEAGKGLLNVYSLKGLGQGFPKVIAVIDSLLPHCFHVKPGSKHGFGHFQHGFILKAIYQVIFTGHHPLAQRYPEKFRQFPVRFVTVICSIIHGVLDKHQLKPHSGNKNKEDQLLLSNVLANYKIHWKSTKLFKANQDKQYDFVFKLLPKCCFKCAGFVESATMGIMKKYKELMANNFAQDKLTKEERIAVGLPPKTTPAGPHEPLTTPPATVKQPKPKELLDNGDAEGTGGVEVTGGCVAEVMLGSKGLAKAAAATMETPLPGLPLGKNRMRKASNPADNPLSLLGDDIGEDGDSAGNSADNPIPVAPQSRPKPCPKPTLGTKLPLASKPAPWAGGPSAAKPATGLNTSGHLLPTSGSKLKSPCRKGLVVELTAPKLAKKGTANVQSKGTRVKAAKSATA